MEKEHKAKSFWFSRGNIFLALLGVLLPLVVLVAQQQQSIRQEAATTHQVVIKNFTMNPPTITINVGDTITWVNQDAEAHDAAADDGSWSTPLLSSGESASITFDEVGTFTYKCRPHQTTMYGYKVIVLPQPSATVAPTVMYVPPTPTSVAQISPTLPLPSVTQAQVGGTTSLALTLLLHGIGNAGDNANPKNSDQSNKNPQQLEKLIRVMLINSSGQTVLEPSGSVTYEQGTGDFRGRVSLGSNFPAGNYTVKVKIQNYLQKIIARDFTITNNTVNTVPAAELITGDVNGSNTLDAADYNAILKCLSKDITGSTCYSDEIKKVDLNDDGIITIADSNLLLREFSLRNGD